MMWLAIVISVVTVAFVLWWLLIRTEGVYLGTRVVIWLYDIYASRYDAIVQHDDVEEHLHLAVPIMRHFYPRNDPLVLDAATGTGRIPLALCQHAAFEGQIFAVDLSRGMLNRAVQKIADNHFGDYVFFGRTDGQNLPFADNSFEAVTCLEALEFMSRPEDALKELVRVLHPGGLLLITRRINEPLMLSRLWSRDYMTQLLDNLGIEQVEFEVWQYDYEKVWGVKSR